MRIARLLTRKGGVPSRHPLHGTTPFMAPLPSWHHPLHGTTPSWHHALVAPPSQHPFIETPSWHQPYPTSRHPWKSSTPWTDPPPPCEQNDRCKNITLPQTSFAGGSNQYTKQIFQVFTNSTWRHSREESTLGYFFNFFLLLNPCFGGFRILRRCADRQVDGARI